MSEPEEDRVLQASAQDVGSAVLELGAEGQAG